MISCPFLLNLNFTHQHGFIKSISTATNLLTYLLTHLNSQRLSAHKSKPIQLLLTSAKPLIKFLILFCYINPVILDCLFVILIGCKVTCRLRFSVVPTLENSSSPFPMVRSAIMLHFGTSVVQYCY
jgi:hypothetical protein